MAVRFVVTSIGVALTLCSTAASAQARRQVPVPRAITELLRDTAFTNWIVVPMSPARIAASLIAEPLDLNGDATPELEVHGINAICQINNCVAWIYRRANDGYERLLTAGSVEDIEPQSTISNKYRDIMTAHHESAWESDLTLYKFDGRQYQRTSCFSRTYRYLDPHDRPHELRHPRVRPVACPPDE